MLKIRLQGDSEETFAGLNGFWRNTRRSGVLQTSEIFSNKGDKPIFSLLCRD